VEGALFVALPGERVDGHAFVDDVLARGAGGAVVSAAWAERNAADNVLVVPDPLQALQRLAGAHRRRTPVPLVAITGSNGKTGTKDLAAAAVASLGPVLKTQGNRNNHIGLPLTLLSLRPEHRAAVVEIGLNHPGELRLLSGLARPAVAVITNVGPAHLEGLGTVAGVARAKAEIVAGLEGNGTLVVPAHSPELEAALAGYTGKRVTFGLEPEAALHPLRVEDHGLLGFTLHLDGGAAVRCRYPGEHAVRNLLAALAAAAALGVSAAAAAPGIRDLMPAAGRLCVRDAAGVILIDDTYNANPASLAAALELLRKQATPGRRWAVLGDMLELGPESPALHRTAGSGAAFLDGLITVGPLARELGRGAVASGLAAGAHREAADGAAAAALLVPDLAPGDLVLVKGSRGIALETAVAAILAARGGDA
jgi:UDP-N-acetylmuramoyl-tripeptide--D-alanyl-D-alanine ligase